MTRRTRAQIRADEVAELERTDAQRTQLERAQAKATARQLLSVKQRIGVELAEACGAATADDLDALERVLQDPVTVQVICERAGLRRHARGCLRGRSYEEDTATEGDEQWARLALGFRGEMEGGDAHA